jgi:hypothetical protein
MREFTLLAIAAAAGLAGMGIGHLLLSKKQTPPVAVVAPGNTTTESIPPVTRITLQTPPVEPVDYDSSPEAIHAWRRADKDELNQRVDRLNNSEAERLCFALQLIPRDEVFDRINVKGRLKRHIDDMRVPGELTDVETAFNELQRGR